MTSIGDRSQAFFNRQHNFDLRSRLNQFTQELSTGQVSDPSSHLAGDFSRLGSVDQAIARNNSYLQNMTQKDILFDHVQLSLGNIQDRVLELEISARSVDLNQQDSAIARIGKNAENAFDAIVGKLNETRLGQSVFSGNATDKPATQTAAVILDGLRSELPPVATATDVQQVVDEWFDTGPTGRFYSEIYTGSKDSASISISSIEKVDPLPKVDDDAIRHTLKGVIMIALTNQPSSKLGRSEKLALIGAAVEPLGKATIGLIDMSAVAGSSQERIAQETSRLNAENTSMEIYRNKMVSADQFETASNLQQVQLQLETHYTVTARLSRLSLVGYLR